MQTVIEIVDQDPKGQRDGTVYKLTSTATISLTEMTSKTDQEIKDLLYPKSTIDYIRGQLVKGNV
jgi:hypothetical protein